MESGLTPEFLAGIDQRLAPTDVALAAAYPGEDERRQPVHTVYVAADTYTPDLPDAWGEQARDLLERNGGTEAMCAVAGVPEPLVADVAPRVEAKLATDPVEDLRLDFEDGYSGRDDATEDADAVRAARQLAAAHAAGRAPAFCGV